MFNALDCFSERHREVNFQTPAKTWCKLGVVLQAFGKCRLRPFSALFLLHVRKCRSVIYTFFWEVTPYKDVNTTFGSSFFKTIISVVGICFSDAKNNLTSSIGNRK